MGWGAGRQDRFFRGTNLNQVVSPRDLMHSTWTTDSNTVLQTSDLLRDQNLIIVSTIKKG